MKVFHDTVISGIEYDGNALIMSASEAEYEDAYENCNIKISVKEDNISIRFVKQYPRFSNAHFKGREITFLQLKRLFSKGRSLMITELWRQEDTETVIFECVLMPFARGGGRCKKVFLELSDPGKIEIIEKPV